MNARHRRALRALAAGACLASVLAGCAGIKPAPVLPIDPIYQPDTTPQPSDAPLIEALPVAPTQAEAGAASSRPASSSAPSPPDSAAGSPPQEVAGATAAPSPGARGSVASPSGASADSSPLPPSSGNGGAESNPPERVALAPPSVPSPLTPGESAAAGAQGGAPPGGPGAPNAAAETGEDIQLVRLLSDLERYGSFTGEELKRELTSASAVLARQHTDANRIRVGVLYSLARTSAQDDQRALQLFETVAKDGSADPAMRHLAVILQTQVLERQRAVKFEQQKGDAAIQKLEALRAMEQSLFRDRVRGGGGGGGGAGGSGR